MKRNESLDEPDDEAARDLWRRTLEQIPTTFGRIVYLASLRDENTGAYRHYGLAQIHTEQIADEAIRQSHRETFSNWLNFPLAEQESDLLAYLGGLDGERRLILETWSQLGVYLRLMPADVSEAERKLYVSDLELILDLLRNELSSVAAGQDSDNRDASQHPRPDR